MSNVPFPAPSERRCASWSEPQRLGPEGEGADQKGLLSTSRSATDPEIQHIPANSNEETIPSGPTAIKYKIAPITPAATSLASRSRISLIKLLMRHP